MDPKPSEPESIWQARWDSLDERLTTLSVRYNDPQLNFPRAVTVYSTVKRLQAFARQHFEWFRDGFFPKAGGYELSPLSELNGKPCGYNPDYAFNAILAQVGQDIDILEDAAESRLSASRTELDTLAKADALAMKALQPAIEAKWFRHLSSDPTVLTYFDKRQTIRVVPYANVALIGIPRTVLLVPRDFLAISHEVGHYVYWHGKTEEDERILKVVERELNLHLAGKSSASEAVKKWAEEMFADAYGAAIGGPVMAFDFQEIANREPEKDFYKDDEDHPTPVIRPALYAKIEALRNGNPRVSDEIAARWEAQRRARPDKDPIGVDTQGNLEDVVEKVYWEKLVKNISPWLPDSTVTLEETDDYRQFSSKLYERFATAVSALTDSVAELPPPSSKELDSIWENWIKAEAFFPNSENPPKGELPPARGVIYAGKQPATFDEPNPLNVWLPVLIARGWTMEGPNSQWKK